MQVEDLEGRMKQLQAANENKQRQLEEMRKVTSSLRSGPLTLGSKRVPMWSSAPDNTTDVQGETSGEGGGRGGC